MKTGNDFFWIDESGRKWTGEQIKHKFDRFIKKAIKHRTRDAMRKLFTQNNHFPVQPDYVLEQIAVRLIPWWKSWSLCLAVHVFIWTMRGLSRR